MAEYRRVTGICRIEWWWMLNPMRGPVRVIKKFGPFQSKESAICWLDNERVRPYLGDSYDPDHFGFNRTYTKAFRHMGPLEWMNAPEWLRPDQDPTDINEYGHGLHRVMVDFVMEQDHGRCQPTTTPEAVMSSDSS